MTTQSLSFSDGFQRLYCDPSIFEPLSGLHPVSFARVLPFRSDQPVVDDQSLLDAEAAFLAGQNDDTRRTVLQTYAHTGLLSVADTSSLVSIDNDSDAEFFETMGTVYANAGMYTCALRWYREYIAWLESQKYGASSDTESVYASVGYCLYSLGLYPEAIAWSKCCIGPLQLADTVCRNLLACESQLGIGAIRCIERAGARTRYLVAASDPAESARSEPRIKAAMESFAPFMQFYVNWVSADTPMPGITVDGYPFNAERESGNLTRHRTNLIFATCAQSDALVAKGCHAEAKRLLQEAVMLEPEAAIVQERLLALA